VEVSARHSTPKVTCIIVDGCTLLWIPQWLLASNRFCVKHYIQEKFNICLFFNRYKNFGTKSSTRTSICDWIWQNQASTHKASLKDTEILGNHCVVASQCLRLCKLNLHRLCGCTSFWHQNYAGVLNGRMVSRDQVWASCVPYMHSNHSKISDITTGKLCEVPVHYTQSRAMATE